jgi:PKD repeat protein
MRHKTLVAAVVTLFVSACGGGGGGGSAAAPVTPPANSAPVAAISVNSTSGFAPLTVAFDGSASMDSDGSISSYAWSTGDGGSYTGDTASHSYDTPGTYSATLTVTDDDGASTSVSITIEVQANVGPVAAITVTKTTGYAPLAVAFDGSSSSDSDGSIASYAWTTGDGASYTGSTASHTYTTLGSFVATLTVTDDQGDSSSTTVTVDVHAQAAGYYWGLESVDGTGRLLYVERQVASDHRVFENVYDGLIDQGTYTTDISTGLDWLDLSVTANAAYSSAETNNPGWRYATNAEVEGLFATFFEPTFVDSGDGSQVSTDAASLAASARFVSLIGATIDNDPVFSSLGYYLDEVSVLRAMGTEIESGVAALIIGPQWGTTYGGSARPAYGTYLVRTTVPEPATLTLVGLASGTLDVAGTATTGTLLMQSDADVYLDGLELGSVDFTGAIDTTMSGDITPRITGDFVGRGDSGLYELYYDEQLNSAKSLADLEGVWSWTDGAGFTETMVIQADGSFVDTATNGCTLVGKFTPMDPGLNEFDIEYDLTCVPVSGAGDGHRKGVAVINDVWYTDIWLDWNVIYQEGPRAGLRGGGSVMRTRPVAGTGTGAQKQRERRSHPDQGVR